MNLNQQYFLLSRTHKSGWFRNILKRLSKTVCVIIKRECQTETRSQIAFVQTYNLDAIRHVVAFFTATTLSLVKPSRHSSLKNALRCNWFSILKPRRTSTHFECIYKSEPPSIIVGSFLIQSHRFCVINTSYYK